ncbi:RNA polymerase sigma factor [Sphingomonas crusticola]|uniref:RNA polymerase sigma factor n=1 Tax=Sphingomonas crusticola TaxID=1697973 RepID=UPI000E2333AD|nr:RNA polymerase sigma factor [Sphingomonas crusticola]
MSLDDPDGELVRRVGEGDAHAIETLVARKLPRMTALAMRLLNDRGEAEDVVQEVFVRVWRSAGAWRPGAAKFDTWMHRVALNLCTDRLRKRREIPLPPHWDTADPSPNADAALDAQAQSDALGQALAALAPRQREAIVLTYYQELPNRDAAALMGIGIDALESLLARGRRALKARLEQADD